MRRGPRDTRAAIQVMVYVLVVSLILQLTAMLQALLLMRLNGTRLAWAMIAAGIILMAVRRSITLYRVVAQDQPELLDPAAESVALAISILFVFGILGVGRVFRRLQESEAALKSSEARFQAFMANSPALAWIKDAGGRLLFGNAAFEKAFGLAGASLPGQTFPDPWTGPTAGAARDRDQAVLENGAPGAAEESFELPGGERRSLLVHRFRLSDPDRQHALAAIAVDVTERRRAEEQLLEARKMEAVGQLAGGVAHGFNNLLTVIRGYTETLLDAHEPNGLPHTDLIEIRKAADRAAALTRQLLVFGRRDPSEPRPLDMNEAVRPAICMLKQLLPPSITLEVDLSSRPLPVRADPIQLEQAALNLTLNGRDAMEATGGGRLTVMTAAVDVGVDEPASHLNGAAGPHALLMVADTGSGVASKDYAHLFEPFFTTKRPDQGTGLGLSLVHGVVSQAEGRIDVRSAPGAGTEIRIYLPLLDALPAAEPAEPADEEAAAPRQAGAATILLVEDAGPVRRLCAGVLEGAGHRVLAAESGGAALDAFEREAARVDVVVTDVVMPGIDGPALVAAIRERCAASGLREPRILFVSGYLGDRARAGADRSPLGAGGEAFLQKPFTPKELLDAVSRLIRVEPRDA